MTRSLLTRTLSARGGPDGPESVEVAPTRRHRKRRRPLVVLGTVLGVIIASLAVNTVLTDAETAPAAATGTIPADEMTYHALTATSLGSDKFLTEPVPQRLMMFGKPILMLYGADDHRWSPSGFAEYRVVPGTRIEAIPGVGHSPMMEDPGRTSSVLLAFLGSVSTR